MLVPTGQTRKRIKHWFEYLPNSHTARMLAYFPLLREWQRKRLDASTPRFHTREAYFDHLIERYGQDEFLYLEFGCASGNAVRYWAERCPHPNARFVGFDTFTGLPERWQLLGWSVEAGIWNLDGKIPEVADPRVSFEKGLFQATLPGFLAKPEFVPRLPRRVIHIDADLYSSTMFVLCSMAHLLPGAVVMFDEFDCPLDELRALADFCAAFHRNYEVLAVTDWCEKIAIRFDP